MRGPVAGWKAGLIIIGTLVAVFVTLNLLGLRFQPRPSRPQPSPTVIR